jgi:hypothetical protein
MSWQIQHRWTISALPQPGRAEPPGPLPDSKPSLAVCTDSRGGDLRLPVVPPPPRQGPGLRSDGPSETAPPALPCARCEHRSTSLTRIVWVRRTHNRGHPRRVIPPRGAPPPAQLLLAADAEGGGPRRLLSVRLDCVERAHQPPRTDPFVSNSYASESGQKAYFRCRDGSDVRRPQQADSHDVVLSCPGEGAHGGPRAKKCLYLRSEVQPVARWDLRLPLVHLWCTNSSGRHSSGRPDIFAVCGGRSGRGRPVTILLQSSAGACVYFGAGSSKPATTTPRGGRHMRRVSR